MSIDGLDQNFNDIQRRFQYLNEEEERRKVFDVGLDIRRGVRIPIVGIGFFGSSHFLGLVVVNLLVGINRFKCLLLLPWFLFAGH